MLDGSYYLGRYFMFNQIHIDLFVKPPTCVKKNFELYKIPPELPTHKSASNCEQGQV